MSTRETIDRLYAAYLSGDVAQIAEQMADDVTVTFVGHGTFHGKAEYQPYGKWAGQQLPELTFNVRRILIDGEYAAVTWDEVGKTKYGADWEAMGVDIHRVVDGKIVELTVYTDTDKMARLFDPFPGIAALTAE
jgi:ketosteroid isomerase-like protein